MKIIKGEVMEQVNRYQFLLFKTNLAIFRIFAAANPLDLLNDLFRKLSALSALSVTLPSTETFPGLLNPSF